MDNFSKMVEGVKITIEKMKKTPAELPWYMSVEQLEMTLKELDNMNRIRVSNRRLSQVISADYLRRKHLSHSAVNDADAHYIGANRRLSRAYFSSAMAGLK